MSSLRHFLPTAGVLLALVACSAPAPESYDVVIVGGGTGGTAAAIEAARNGARVLVVEEGPWLGGMLTSAGVSAIDGNYRLRGGIFGEFADSLAARYGGYEALRSGWVSNILFNPRVGAEILENMTREAGVTCRMNTTATLRGSESPWTLSLSDGTTVSGKILIDGTELGDVAAAAGLPMLEDSRALQDMTYVAVLKEYDADVTPQVPPAGYDPVLYRSCCDNPLAERGEDPGVNRLGQPLWSAEMMLSYGRLPDGEVMLNWPVFGNDIFLEYLDLPREEVYRLAKERTLGYVYFIQTELGYRNWGLSDDVFPTDDLLPVIPYYRESRRIAGRDTMTLAAAKNPYAFDLYTRAVAVGDYPVDHHHMQHPLREELSHLWYGRVPSFSVPVGVLIPVEKEDFLVADKAISVSWEMNGGTRLQPVVMGLGQAAGALSALAVREGIHPSEVPVTVLQRLLLDHGCYLLPFLDCKPGDPGFRELQEQGVRGEVRGTGRSVGWANETWVKIPDHE